MTVASCDAARRYFVEMQHRRGNPIYRHELQVHRCTKECTFFGVPGMKPPHYVCEFSQHVHICGEQCTEHEPLPRNEGHVCRFTGMVLPFVDYTREISAPEGDETACYRGRGRKHSGGPTYTRIASTAPKRAAKRPRVFDKGKQINTIATHLTTILSGDTRKKLYHDQILRFEKEVLKIVKTSSAGASFVPYSDILPRIVQLRHKYGFYLNPPVPNINRDLVRRIATTLSDYLQEISPYIDIDVSGKMLSAYTAFMAQRLAHGYFIGDTMIIPQFRMFHRHVPEPILYSKLKDIFHNKISRLNCNFKRACVRGGENGAPVRHVMILPREKIPLPP